MGTGALRDGALHVDAYAHSLRSSHSSNEARPRCGMSNAEAVAESISPPTALIEEKISSSWPEILSDTQLSRCMVKKTGCEPDDVELSPIQAAHTRLRRGMYMYRREDAVVLVKEAFRDRSSDDADGCFLRSHSSHFPSHAVISSYASCNSQLAPICRAKN